VTQNLGPFPGATRVGLTPNSPLLDQYGRSIFGSAFDPPHDPLDYRGAKHDALVVMRDLPLISAITGDWSLPLIKSALADQTRGLFNTPADLADAISADDRVQATVGSRTGGLFSQPLTHQGGSKECRRAWRRAWRKLLPQSVASELMTWAVLLGFAVAEILWDKTVTPWQPYLKVWHPKWVWYRWDRRCYSVITLDGLRDVVPGTGKWLLFTPHGPYRGWMRGVIRSIADKWFIKGLAWRDWARFNERHGLPIFKAKVPAAGDINQKKNFIAALARLGQESVIGLPQNVDGTGYDAELLEARDRAWESFMGTINRCDASIVLPIMWQNLTTEVTEGSYAAARIHGGIRQNAIQFDASTLSEAMYEQVARPYALFNFGDADDAPTSTWNVTPFEDYNAKADTFYKFGQALQQMRMAGKKIKDVRKLAKQFGIDPGEIDDVDPTQVQAKKDAAQAGGGDSFKSLEAQLKKMRGDFARIEARLAA
jgi:Protein of unknown function (DUF935)